VNVSQTVEGSVVGEQGTRIAAAAPGDWCVVPSEEGAAVVDVTLRAKGHGDAVRAQVTLWQHAVERKLVAPGREGDPPAALLLPRWIDETDADTCKLSFPAPERVGADAMLDHESTPHDVLHVLHQLAVALDGLHARGFVHGALSMHSIWWMADGTVRFPDAGLTHVMDGLIAAPAETAAYLAPEAWRAKAIVAASDQYSLAVIAFELFTGRRRFEEDAVDGVRSVATLALESRERLYDGAPEELNDLLTRALSVTPASRYPSCVAFVTALEECVRSAAPLAAHAGASNRSSGVWTPRLWAVGAVVVLAIGVGASVARSGLLNRRTVPPVAIDVPRIASAATRAGENALARVDLSASGPATRTAGTRGATAAGSSRASTSQSRAPSRTAATASNSAPPAPRTRPPTPPREATPVSRPTERTVASAAKATPRGQPASAPRVASSTVPVRRGQPAGAPSIASDVTPNETRIVAETASARSLSAIFSSERTRRATDTVPRVEPTTGTVRVAGPRGARYYVDGVLVRPVRGALTLPEGEHDIRIVIPNSGSVVRRVVLHRGEVLTVK
jgi:Protein kinase domain